MSPKKHEGYSEYTLVRFAPSTPPWRAGIMMLLSGAGMYGGLATRKVASVFWAAVKKQLLCTLQYEDTAPSHAKMQGTHQINRLQGSTPVGTCCMRHTRLHVENSAPLTNMCTVTACIPPE